MDRRASALTDARFIVPIVFNFITLAIAVVTIIVLTDRRTTKIELATANSSAMITQAIARFEGQISTIISTNNTNTNDMTGVKADNAARGREIDQLRQELEVLELKIEKQNETIAMLNGRLSR